MFITIISWVLRLKYFFLSLVILLAVASVFSLRNTSLDAIPDIADPQLVVYVKWQRSPDVIESSITAPIASALLGIDGVQSVRATSHLGYSFIYIVLDNENSRLAVKRLVSDRINDLRQQLPGDALIQVGPNASSMGWIFEYALIDHNGTRDLRELRILHENSVKPVLQSMPGIAEVATVGGLERQVELKLFPPLLEAQGITLRQVIDALRSIDSQVGGRSLEITNREYQLKARLNGHDIDNLEHLLIGRNKDNKAVLLRDLGYLQVDYDLRRGIADLDGKGEVVGAIVIMEQQQNVLAVSTSLKEKLAKIAATLPEGIEIVTTYDRSNLIWTTLKNFSSALLYELLVVALVIVWALKNGRAAVAPVVVILLGCLLTILPLTLLGQTVNLLSLAGLAIAIGEMADATIVIVENCTTELAKHSRLTQQQKRDIIIRATARMTRPLLFSLFIILASFLPVFFLNEREGRLFDPLAFSKTFAMGFSTFLTVVLLPILIVWVFKNTQQARAVKDSAGLVNIYRRSLRLVIRLRYYVVGASLALLAGSLVVLSSLPKEYMPTLEEGSILYMPTTLPGLPTREAGWILQQMDKRLKEIPEVEHVFGKLGRADTSTDPAPMSMVETTILLKPETEWRAGIDKAALLKEMDQVMQFVGYVNTWTQPIAGRMIMQDTGIQSPVGLKVKGPDLERISDLAIHIESLLREFNPDVSVLAERISDGYYIDVEQALPKLAQYGVALDEAMLAVRYGIGGDNVINLPQTDKTTAPLSVQYSPEYIDTVDKIKNSPVATVSGDSVVLADIANVVVQKFPEMIRHDNGQMAGYIYIDPGSLTPVDFVEATQSYLNEHLELPTGYSIEWTGTYTYTVAAQERLLWIVPMTFLIMFVLLFFTFRSWIQSVLILFSAPFALVGGVVLQWWQGHSLTTAVVIGYIAVLAVAIQTGIIMVEFIRDAIRNKSPEETYTDALVKGSVARLRPKLMTVATTFLGLLPIIFVSGSGMDVTQPIAVPSIGGMVSSTLYVLYLIPCLFAITKDIQDRINMRKIESTN